MERNKQEYYGLQVLRAVAALAVVAGHATDDLVKENGSVPGQLSWLHGPAGVDIFFVISGFVMMITSERLSKLASPARAFLLRRVVRIVPLYWSLTALRLLVTHLRPALASNGVATTWNAIASFLFIPARALSGQIRPVIPVGWTLSFEFAFYLLFAVGLAWRGRLLPVVTCSVIALAAVGGWRTEAWPAWTALADPIVLEFLAGVWLAWLLMRGRRIAHGGWLVMAGAAGLVLFAPTAWPFSRPLVWGSSALLLVAGVTALESRIAGRIPAWMLVLGNASYSIYLVQTFVFPAEHLAFDRVVGNRVHTHPLAIAVLLIAVSVPLTSLVGVAVYRWFELPLTRSLRRAVGVSQPKAVPA
jgi:exopolysaccharide production protein ExoZ